MNNLRSIVRRHIEEETLQQFLQANYATTSAAEKQRILTFASDTIETKVQQILNAFLEEITQSSPERKKARRYQVFSAIITLIASTGLAHAVNLENLSYIITCALIILILQLYSIFK
ncbi:TPA: hypothetical protein QCQ26_001860 [Bacillus cereus]|nr:hypothetical protein [Bacillus cereus]